MKMAKLKIKNSNQGFTLVELLVCISIITVLAAVLLGNRSRYSERLILKNQTYNMALYLRQAQVYSLGVKGSGSPTTFNTPYGVYFENTVTNQFIFFTDENTDGKFQTTETNEVVPLSNGVSIQKICGMEDDEDDEEKCGNPLKRITVTFKRPSPAALIRFLNNVGVNGGNDINSIYPPAIIYLVSQTGLVSSTTISASGAISIQGN
jgi:prepilin-type N-terminal cleavage/methylation domain-containing protein